MRVHLLLLFRFECDENKTKQYVNVVKFWWYNDGKKTSSTWTSVADDVNLCPMHETWTLLGLIEQYLNIVEMHSSKEIKETLVPRIYEYFGGKKIKILNCTLIHFEEIEILAKDIRICYQNEQLLWKTQMHHAYAEVVSLKVKIKLWIDISSRLSKTATWKFDWIFRFKSTSDYHLLACGGTFLRKKISCSICDRPAAVFYFRVPFLVMFVALL